MARTQYTFTFTNAQPGADVGFNFPAYADASTPDADGPSVVLDSTNSVSVWADSDYLIAHTVDGRGVQIVGVATHAYPTQTIDAGVAGSSPFGSGGSTHVGVGDSFYLHYAEDRASTASNLVFDGQTPTIVGSTFSIDANNPGGVVVATGGVIAVTFMSTVQGATPGNEGAYVEAQVALYNGNGLVTQKQKPLASTETTIMTCVLVALVDDAESVLFTHYHEDTVDATLGVNVSVYIQKIA